MLNYKTAGPGGTPLPNLDVSDPTNHPYGNLKNETTPGAQNGSPVQKEVIVDPMQAMYACLVASDIAPSEAPENVVVSQFLTALKNMFHDVGDIKFHYGVNSPSSNWLICNGDSFNGTQYPLLETFLGGTTLPDFEGRVVAGYKASEVEYNAIGKEGGANTHTLSVAQMPDHGHTVTLNTAGSDGGDVARGSVAGSVGSENTSTTGDGDPHNNLQPYKVVRILIKAK